MESINDFRRSLSGLRFVLAVLFCASAFSSVGHAEPNPSDPGFSKQWYLHNTGQEVNGRSGPEDVDIDWLEALALKTGTTPVIVAVLDTGAALDHPELTSGLWINPGEIPDNGIDEDGNGFIDDISGWDFFDNDNLPQDENGHGTLIAGLIAGAGGNNEGGTGVAPHVKVMVLRCADVVDSTGLPVVSEACFLQATTYAAEMGARIIHAGFGHTGYSAAEETRIQWLDDQGILVVTTAGNGGPDLQGDDNDLSPVYPASYTEENVISAAAVDRQDALAPFSNFGAAGVDLAAPGTDIYGADISRTTLFFDDLELGDIGWMKGHLSGPTDYEWATYTDDLGNTWLGDSVLPGETALYLPDTNSWAQIFFLFNLEEMIGPRLQFRSWTALAPSDRLLVEVSKNGMDWETVDILTGNSSPVGGLEQIDLSAYEGDLIDIRFRLMADGLLEADGIYIDNVTVSEAAPFQYDGTQYQFGKGTSFAASLVTGVAALLVSENPDLTHHQLRRLILENVDPVDDLAGKVSTGGRLNAYKALIASLPPVADAGEDRYVVIGDTVTLDGSGSFDPAGDALGLQWNQVSGPATPLSGNLTPALQISPPEIGIYRFELTATDSYEIASIPDPVSVYALHAPPLVFQTVSAAAGGSLIVSGETPLNTLTVTFSPGVLPEDTTVSINIVPEPPPLGEGIVGIGEVIHLEPEGLTFSEPVEIRIPYDPSELESLGIKDMNLLKVYSFNPASGQWEAFSGVQVDEVTHRVVIAATHFSLFRLGIPKDAIPVIVDAGGDSGTGSGGGGCFIATAAFGSYEEPHVKVLRDFRDRFLLTHPPGRIMVDIYYTVSPPLADYIQDKEIAKALVRIGLLPLIGISMILLGLSGFELGFLGLVLPGVTALLFWFITMRIEIGSFSLRRRTVDRSRS